MNDELNPKEKKRHNPVWGKMKDLMKEKQKKVNQQERKRERKKLNK